MPSRLDWTPGTGTPFGRAHGQEYKAGTTADGVQHNWYRINFGSGVFTAAPRFLASPATYDGADNAHLRYKRSSLTKDGVQVMIEEDKDTILRLYSGQSLRL